MPRRRLAAAIALAAGACTGPHTTIHNPEGHRVFVDGRELDRTSLPFRYYGTSRWDAQPRDLGQPRPVETPPEAEPAPPPQAPQLQAFDIHGWQPSMWLPSDAELVPAPPPRRVPLGATRPDWDLQPASQAIELPPPVSPWLFPLDFPLELLGWALGGQDDFTTTVELPATPVEERPSAEFRPVELDRVAERARQARASR
ncbi:MAG: hypothetical protein H6838_11345 [Planctomycetes bacterium]|nr:hypothetical protein [Planctomycetota bacterium]MCB9886079.1 hypothetical protein [Planctomycetota bacterium]